MAAFTERTLTVVVIVIAICSAALLWLYTKPLNPPEAYQQGSYGGPGVSLEHLMSLLKRNQPRYLSWEQYAVLGSGTFQAFNPGCFVVQNTLYVVVRICNYTACGLAYDRPKNIVSALIVVNTVSGEALVVDVENSDFVSRQGLEDAKCIVHGETLHIFCTYLDRYSRPRMCNLNTSLNGLLHDMSSGKEIRAFSVHALKVVKMPLHHVEKNWMPLVLNDNMYMIYRLEPLVLLRVDTQTWNCTKVMEHRSGTFAWDIIRGTSNVIDYDGQKLCLGHYRNDDDFQYYHVFVKLTADADIRIVKLSCMFKFQRGHRIEFGNGLAMDDYGNVIVTYGAEDCSSNVLVIGPAKMQELFESDDRLMYLVD